MLADGETKPKQGSEFENFKIGIGVKQFDDQDTKERVKNNEILVVLDEGLSTVDMELAGKGGKSENIDGTDVSENGSTDVVEEGLQGLD